MIDFDKETTRKLAQLSGLSLHDDELERFTRDLGSVLEYAAQLQAVAATLSDQQPAPLINVMREDHAYHTDTTRIRTAAPCMQDNFFVVPKIIG